MSLPGEVLRVLERRDRIAAGALALLCLAFQTTVVLGVFTRKEQFLKYTEAARLFLAGGMAPDRFFDFSPLYLLVHIASARLFATPAPAIQMLQLLLGAGTAYLLYLLVRQRLPPLYAAAGVVALTLSPGAVIFTHVFEPEICVLFLVTALLVLVSRPTLPRLLAGGLILALLVLTRQVFLPLVLLPLASGVDSGGRGRLLRGWALFCLPVLAVLLPLWTKSLAAQGGWPPAVMNPGQVFFEGNNPLSNGQSAVPPPLVMKLQPELSTEPDSAHIVYRVLSGRILGTGSSPRVSNAYWGSKALKYVVDHPGSAIRRLLFKGYLVFHGYQQHDLLLSHLDARALREGNVPRLPFALVSTLALAGIAASLRTWRDFLPLYLLTASQTLVMLAFYVSERQRLALLPVFIVFACHGVTALVQSRRAALIGVPVVCAGTALFSLPLSIQAERAHFWESLDRRTIASQAAHALRERGELAAASEKAAEALALDPLALESVRPAFLSFRPKGIEAEALEIQRRGGAAGAPARFDRAFLLLAAGDPATAEPLLQDLVREGHRVLRGNVASSRPEYYLARCRLRRGDREGAKALLLKALDQAPGDPYVLSSLMALTGERRFGEELFRYFDDADAAFLLGQARLEAGAHEDAAHAFSYVTSVVPEHRRAYVYLAAALGRAGRLGEAAEAYSEALRLGEDPVLLEDDITGIYRRLAEAEPDNPRRQREAAAVHFRYGRYGEAAALLRRLSERHSDPAVTAELSRVEEAAGRYR